MGKSKVISIQRDRWFTTDRQWAQDDRLSYKARGIMAYVMSKPDDWDVWKSDLVQNSVKDGETAVQSGVRELIDLGYGKYEPIRDPETNHFQGQRLLLRESRDLKWPETPKTGSSAENPISRGSGNPRPGKPGALEKEDYKNKKNNTKDEERGGGGARARMPEQIAAVYDTYEWLVNKRLNLYDPGEADQLLSKAWGQLSIGSATMQLVDEYSWPLFVTGVTIAEHEADSPNARFLHTVLKRLYELQHDDTDYTETGGDEARSNLDRLLDAAESA